MQDEYEIDLRKYILALFRNIKWVIIPAVIAAIGFFIFLSVTPPIYESTAIVAISQSRYVANFDPRFQTVQDLTNKYKAYPELALSDDLVRELFTGLQDKPADIRDYTLLKKHLKAVNGTDPSLVLLTVESDSPEMAADIARLWSLLFVSRARTVFGGQDTAQADFFQTQRDLSKQELDRVEQALIAFQQHSPLKIIENELGSALQAQSEYLAEKRKIESLLQDIDNVKQELAGLPGDSIPTFSDQLALVYLQARAFDSSPSSPVQGESGTDRDSRVVSTNPPTLQLQIDSSANLWQMSISDQIAYLNRLESTLTAQASQVDAHLETLAPQILDLQGTAEAEQVKLDSLTQARDIAKETYMTLARKVDETRISTEDNTSLVRLAAEAIPPNNPMPRNRVRNALIGGVVVAILAAAVLMTIEWARGTFGEAGGDEKQFVSDRMGEKI